jgi:hypothetical protein
LNNKPHSFLLISESEQSLLRITVLSDINFKNNIIMRNLLKKVILLASAFLFAAGGPMWATPTVTQINATSSSFDALVTGNAVLIHVGGSHAGFVYEDPNTHFLCVNTSITQADAASQNAFLFMVTRTNDAFSFRNKASNLYMPAVGSPHLEQLVDATTAGSFTVASYVTDGSDFLYQEYHCRKWEILVSVGISRHLFGSLRQEYDYSSHNGKRSQFGVPTLQSDGNRIGNCSHIDSYCG